MLEQRLGDPAGYHRRWLGHALPAQPPIDVAPGGSGVADVFFDTLAHNNLFIGRAGSVVDLGTNNRFIDSPNRAAGARREVTAAQPTKRHLLDQSRAVLSKHADLDVLIDP